MIHDHFIRESGYYAITKTGVQCQLCPHNCSLTKEKTGRCHTRFATENKLFTTAYGNPCAMHIDPVEKKPLYHFLPGSACLSVATAGCNLTCMNCQNWEISQAAPRDVSCREAFPDEVITTAVSSGCRSIAYTYTEPTVFYEYMYDTAVLAKAHGLRNIIISNGFINKKPLMELAGFLDAANIDLKSFSDKTYQTLGGGRLQPVLHSLEILKNAGVWLEITNLIIPGLTDDLNVITSMCEWLVGNGFAGTPLHFSRFYGQYRLKSVPSTPVSVLEKAREIAISCGIRFVYLGNVVSESENTFCPDCKRMVVKRDGYQILRNDLINGQCRFCRTPVEGEWC